MLQPWSRNRRDDWPCAIGLRIAPSHAHGFRVDIARQCPGLAGLRRGDGKNSGAAADIQNPARPPLFEDAVQRQQAALGGAVVAGPERGSRVDLERNAANPALVPVMGTVQEEAPGLDRRKALQRLPDPVSMGQGCDQGRSRLQSHASCASFRLVLKISNELPIGARLDNLVDDDSLGIEANVAIDYFAEGLRRAEVEIGNCEGKSRPRHDSSTKGTIWISTRRFCALPEAELLEAIGWLSPRPSTEKRLGFSCWAVR